MELQFYDILDLNKAHVKAHFRRDSRTGKLVFIKDHSAQRHGAGDAQFHKGDTIKVVNPKSKHNGKEFEVLHYSDKYDCVRVKVPGQRHTADFRPEHIVSVKHVGHMPEISHEPENVPVEVKPVDVIKPEGGIEAKTGKPEPDLVVNIEPKEKVVPAVEKPITVGDSVTIEKPGTKHHGKEVEVVSIDGDSVKVRLSTGNVTTVQTQFLSKKTDTLQNSNGETPVKAKKEAVVEKPVESDIRERAKEQYKNWKKPEPEVVEKPIEAAPKKNIEDLRELAKRLYGVDNEVVNDPSLEKYSASTAATTAYQFFGIDPSDTNRTSLLTQKLAESGLGFRNAAVKIREMFPEEKVSKPVEKPIEKPKTETPKPEPVKEPVQEVKPKEPKPKTDKPEQAKLFVNLEKTKKKPGDKYYFQSNIYSDWLEKQPLAIQQIKHTIELSKTIKDDKNRAGFLKKEKIHFDYEWHKEFDKFMRSADGKSFLEQYKTRADLEKTKKENRSVEFKPAKTTKEAEGWLKKTYNIEANYKGISVDMANSVNQGVSDTINKLPILKKRIGSVTVSGRLGKSTIAYNNLSLQSGSIVPKHSIVLNKKVFSDTRSFEDFMQSSINNGWIPEKLANPQSMVAHELSHSIEGMILLKEVGAKADMQMSFESVLKSQSLTKYGFIGSDINSAAMKKSGMKFPQWLNGIKDNLGRYALANHSEMIAQAFADVLTSKKPSDISKMIYDATLEKLNK